VEKVKDDLCASEAKFVRDDSSMEVLFTVNDFSTGCTVDGCDDGFRTFPLRTEL